MDQTTMCSARARSLRANLWQLFIYLFLGEFWLIVPVLIPYFQSHGLSTAECLAVQAIYALGVIALEVPSGYLADRLGRRTALMAGGLLIMSGLLAYAMATSFIGFALAELLIAAGNAMRSGTDAALVYDTLLELREEDRYAVWQGRSEMWGRFGMATASILGGLAALVSLRLPFWVNIGTGAVMTALAWALVEPARKQIDAPMWRGIMEVVSGIMKSPDLLRVTLFSGLLRASGVLGVWSYVLYYQACGIKVGIHGVLWAVFGVVCGLGARWSSALTSRLGSRVVFVLCATVIPGGFASLGLVRSAWFLPLAWLNGFLWNCAAPQLLSRANRAFATDRRATSISVMALCGSLLYAGSAPLFGRLVDTHSLGMAYIVLAVASAIAAWITMPASGAGPDDRCHE